MTATVFRQSYMTHLHRSAIMPLCFHLLEFSLMVGLLHAMALWCFCLLAESYETINHYHCRYAHSYHDEVFNFTCVVRTKHYNWCKFIWECKWWYGTKNK